MKAVRQRRTAQRLIFGGLLIVALMVAASISVAHDHDKIKKPSLGHGLSRDQNAFGSAFGGERDKGDETTGEIAAWSLGAINLTVALSLLIRGVKRLVPVSPELKASLTKFNQRQKKYLMPFHYYLNPMFIGAAILHWLKSQCKSTALSEWGLLTICIIAVFGIVLKFKLASGTALRNVYKVHTQPAVFISVVGLVVVGHLIMD